MCTQYCLVFIQNTKAHQGTQRHVPPVGCHYLVTTLGDPVQNVKPVVRHVVALTRLSIKTAWQERLVRIVCSRLLVAVVPHDHASGVRRILDYVGIKSNVDRAAGFFLAIPTCQNSNMIQGRVNLALSEQKLPHNARSLLSFYRLINFDQPSVI